jgi:iron complex outermembrane receptor protein
LVFDEVLLFSSALSLIPSVRFDRTGPFTGVSPKLGALLTLPAGFDLRGNIGRAFRAPSFLELYVAAGSLLPNPALKPERSIYADLALGHRTAISWVSAGAFYSTYQNLISYEYYPPLLAKAYNFNSAQVYGLEVEGELKPSPLVSALLGYTMLFSQNLRDDPRYYLKELPYRPRHKVYARVAGGPPIARLRSELNFQSQQFFNRTETLSVPARAMLNAGISSELLSSPQITASFEVKNLLNVQTQDLDGYPLPGRAAYLTLRVAYGRPANKNGNQRHGDADETH